MRRLCRKGDHFPNEFLKLPPLSLHFPSAAKREKRVVVEEEEEEEMIKWWEKMVVVPLRRVWVSLSCRVKPPRSGNGLLKLHEDVETCGYQDVQVMWEMLKRSEPLSHSSERKQRPFWRNFLWSNRRKATSLTLPT
ncbi:hypothetical protein AKJ16_DCAP19455 [Drosera capensis]